MLIERMTMGSSFRFVDRSTLLDNRQICKEILSAVSSDLAVLPLNSATFRSVVEMRPLDEAETTQVFEKLFKFTGNNLKNIVESPSHEGLDKNPGRYCFRLHKNRVYYVSESLVKRATNIKRENLVALGTNIGKFTKSGKFHLTIQALNLLAANAKHKVWLKPTSEMSFLYGNDVVKGGLGRITDNINAYDGVVVFSMSDVPLGFGIAAKSTQDCRKMDPNGLVVIRQADTGEFLRNQDDL
ncbi:Pseudouridine synthase/archaeosine transglycosylase [Cynara cardunculus var. scolymus]|uniref:Pseudouridine synthase/archaeosine transglycosylase n=2 Tax=Cynara cardunculus var. scolymus TaxID=59895 RepID=A0A124SFM9_CYNCS|nr:Pseudouridine synthase/archaeosine transglycosylase [Cynara cardunculus var. scolymus]